MGRENGADFRQSGGELIHLIFVRSMTVDLRSEEAQWLMDLVFCLIL